jgi:hypothetical protein
MTRHLIHIGYPKTGSNFLRGWFAAHPQLAFADGGIAGFGSVYDIARQAGGAATSALYRVTSAEGLATPHPQVGDAAPVDYERMTRIMMPAAQADVCGTLADIFPNARVLIVTRGFRSMILSAYSQYVRTGGTLSFADFAAPRGAGAQTFNDAWNYDHMIELFRAAFAPEDVILLPYELLREDAGAFTAALEARLGLAPFQHRAERANRSLSPVELAWYPKVTRLIGRLPLGRLRPRIQARYFAAGRVNRLAGPIGILQRLRPQEPVTAASVPDAAVEACRGRAERLRDEPLYARYAAEYLF